MIHFFSQYMCEDFWFSRLSCWALRLRSVSKAAPRSEWHHIPLTHPFRSYSC